MSVTPEFESLRRHLCWGVADACDWFGWFVSRKPVSSETYFESGAYSDFLWWFSVQNLAGKMPNLEKLIYEVKLIYVNKKMTGSPILSPSKKHPDTSC